MKPIDGTKLVRQFIYLPNVVPLYGVLLVLLLPFLIIPPDYVPPCSFSRGGNCELPEITNASYIVDCDIPSIKINKKREILVSGTWEKIKNFSELSLIIEDEIEEKRYENKVLLWVDKHIEFGTVQLVLKAVKEAGVKVVGLRTAHST